MGEKSKANKNKKGAKERKINYSPVIFNGPCCSSNMIGRKFSLPS
jgi:hypothetical protein